MKKRQTTVKRTQPWRYSIDIIIISVSVAINSRACWSILKHANIKKMMMIWLTRVKIHLKAERIFRLNE